MNSKSIEIGRYYRLRSSCHYGYVKILDILKPKTSENTTTRILVKVEHTVNKNDRIGFIRFFHISDLQEAEE